MGIKNAVVERIKNLCKQKNIKFNELATRSGVTPSTVYSMLDERRLDVGIVVLKKLCDGLDITITEFFNDLVFENLEQEIK
ncbi:MAG: helix-turn-helix transcriptional regulator [Ruminococcaceae bacterium]|nr:helix-turn-helix transcriptional regulator [Oscillospiraceae bacterium]